MAVCEFVGLPDDKPTYPGEEMFTCAHGHTLTWATARRVLGLPLAAKGRREKRMSEVTEAQEQLLDHKANCILCMHLPDSEVDTGCHEGMHLLKRWNEVMEA